MNGPEAYGIRSVRDKRYRLVWNLNYQKAFSNNITTQNGPYGIYGSWKEKAEEDPIAAQQVRTYLRRPEWELYDLKKDPFELNNLAGQAALAKQEQRLRTELKAWMTQQGDEGVATELDALNRQ